jgi:hypothetical protein
MFRQPSIRSIENDIQLMNAAIPRFDRLSAKLSYLSFESFNVAYRQLDLGFFRHSFPSRFVLLSHPLLRLSDFR